MSQRTHEERVKEVAWQTGWADESGTDCIVEEIIRAYHAELEADGWQVTRKTPTEEMEIIGDDMLGAGADISATFSAMLDISPSPLDPDPSQQGQDDSGDQQPLPTEMKSGESHDRKA